MNVTVKSYYAFVACLLAIVAGAIAQSIVIEAPANGDVVAPGSTVTIQVARPTSLTTSTEVALVIGLTTCDLLSACTGPSSSLGTVLDTVNDFSPTAQSVGAPPSQNFTITMPLIPLLGNAQLNFAHFFLVGVSRLLTLRILHRVLGMYLQAQKQATLEFLDVNLTINPLGIIGGL